MSFIHSIENKEVGIQITIAPYRTTPIEKKMKIDTARTQKYTVVRNSFQDIVYNRRQISQIMTI